MSPHVRFEPRRFARFIAVGGIAAGANIGARWLLSFAMTFEAAVALSYLVGMTMAFVLMRFLVFDLSERSVSTQFLRFTMVNAISFGQVWIVSVGLVRCVFPAAGFVWHDETVGHAIGVISPVVTSYLLHQRFSFAQSRDQRRRR
ncbi:GtrA family protein [Sphingomonas paeninsulae]|uniref:GtrA family protein n=2 Tax=Sphingomonas paeninsulae TaxID=2319844 RepID=A0A494TBB9_SPHPE|nr:GtrA family protein [Sphingomonas paeninsulae]